MNKKLSVRLSNGIKNCTEKYPTPFYLYDEQAMRVNAKQFLSAFAVFPEFSEYFAVKANPNPHILKILRSEGLGADCSSLAELILAQRAGISGERIVFTSNNTPAEEYIAARQAGALINFDDVTHVDYFLDHVGALPHMVSFRFNPGPVLEGGNAIIGKPEEAKYGCTKRQIIEAVRRCAALGVRTFGLHTMVASNESELSWFESTATMMFSLALAVYRETGIKVSLINLGGGVGIPYRPEQTAVDYEKLAAVIAAVYRTMIAGSALHPVALAMECGRVITGPYGYLITKAIHKKNIYKNYIGVDACMADLMRPGMYGAYHHISVLEKEHHALTEVYDVVGSLCENNDKFAIDRPLPMIENGDTLVIHDAGAHGHSMGFNYNGRLRPAEYLLDEQGNVRCIRRAETLDDYFSTLDMNSL